MPGLVLGIHDFGRATETQIVDGRDKPGHDGGSLWSGIQTFRADSLP
jgi:hypothetical protein